MFFWLRNWIFLPDAEEVNELQSLSTANKKRIRNWVIFSVGLPFLPVIVTFLINVLFEGFQLEFLVTGSIPIVAFGIISSNISYLTERLSKTSKVVEIMKKRILGVGVLILFLLVCVFVVESVVKFDLKDRERTYLFISSMILLFYSISIGIKMFLFQDESVKNKFDKEVVTGGSTSQEPAGTVPSNINL